MKGDGWSDHDKKMMRAAYWACCDHIDFGGLPVDFHAVHCAFYLSDLLCGDQLPVSMDSIGTKVGDSRHAPFGNRVSAR